MKLLVFLIGTLVVAFADTDVLTSVKQFSDGGNQFSSAVYQELAKTNTGNFLFSPLSVEIVLALAQVGAQGATAQEITNGLYLPDTVEKVKEALQNVLHDLKGNEHYKLSSANKVFVKEGFEINEEFNKVARDVFGSETENVNFEEKAEAISRINHWVEQQTNDKIKNLVKEDDVNSLTRFILVNTLYFNGKWLAQFPHYGISKQPFYLNKNDTFDTDLMYVGGYFKYYESEKLNAQILELPYQGEDIVFTVVLPKEKDGLAVLEELHANNIFLTPDYKTEKVHVTLPKFTINSEVQFGDILQRLGVNTPFDQDKADFSGIVADKQLYINKVIQKAFINVTESGTEAAASTALIQAEVLSAPINPPKSYYFAADHPFVFYIRHLKTGVNLFVGRVTKPEVL